MAKPSDPLMRTTREPARDTRAQVAAVADPASSKRAAFIAAGTPPPKSTPTGLLKVKRPEGTLITGSPAHAMAFAAAPRVTAARMAPLLGYPESKPAAIASGAPLVVQGRTKRGAVAHESLASPPGLLAAALAAKAAVPGGKVRVMTPQAAQARRKGIR